MSHPGPDAGDRVALACPSCTPTATTVHEVLKPGGQVTVRCTECDHVHKTTLPEERTVDMPVVISQDGDSFKATVDAPAEETLSTGEEFVAETDEAIMTVRITSLELHEDRKSTRLNSSHRSLSRMPSSA